MSTYDEMYKKAEEVLRLMQHPATIDPVANDLAKAHNLALVVQAMRWAMVQARSDAG
jgi:hypothetical protein